MNDLAGQLVDATRGSFPQWQSGTRAAHANGVGLRGWFHPSGVLADLTSAPHLAGPDPVRVLARFSNGAGTSPARDGDRDARGLAVKFHPDTPGATDLIAMTLSSWFTRTPETFLRMAEISKPVPVVKETWRETLDRVLHLRKPYAPPEPGATEELSPRLLADFAHENPEARKAVATAGHLITPRSYARAAYHGVHAFILVNGDRRTHVRYTWYPTAGVRAVSKKQPHKTDGVGNWLRDEIRHRVTIGPVGFVLNIYLADIGDDVTDPTKPWPKKRRRLIGGRLLLDEVPTDQDADCERPHFNPGRLVPGIELSADPVLRARVAAYEESGRRREAVGCPLDHPEIDLRDPAPDHSVADSRIT